MASPKEMPSVALGKQGCNNKHHFQEGGRRGRTSNTCFSLPALNQPGSSRFDHSPKVNPLWEILHGSQQIVSLSWDMQLDSQRRRLSSKQSVKNPPTTTTTFCAVTQTRSRGLLPCWPTSCKRRRLLLINANAAAVYFSDFSPTLKPAIVPRFSLAFLPSRVPSNVSLFLTLKLTCLFV